MPEESTSEEEESSHGSSCLSLHYSSSPFNGDGCTSDDSYEDDST